MNIILFNHPSVNLEQRHFWEAEGSRKLAFLSLALSSEHTKSRSVLLSVTVRVSRTCLLKVAQNSFQHLDLDGPL